MNENIFPLGTPGPVTVLTPAGRPTTHGGSRLRILLVCNLLVLPYKVLLTLSGCDADVTVLGNHTSLPLRRSRLCQRFILSDHPFDGRTDLATAQVINSHALETRATMILPGDQNATRTIAGLQRALTVACFPTPNVTIYDRLYNKLYFLNMCAELDILTPPSRLWDTSTAIQAAVKVNDIQMPAICKPLDADGGNGVLKLTKENADRQLRRIDYAPILSQDFIEGEDIGASVYCVAGSIEGYVIHRLKQQTYSTFRHEGIVESLWRIMAHLNSDGVYNFDMRLARDGRVFFLECNPRFYLKMPLSMWAGMNFLRLGMGGQEPFSLPDGRCVRLPKALAADLVLRPWMVTRRDWRALKVLITDPIPFIFDSLRIWKDNEQAINFNRETERHREP